MKRGYALRFTCMRRAVGQRLQVSCRGLVFAAGVALRQVGVDHASHTREHPAFVHLLDDRPERFARGERVGPWVLTTELTMPLEDGRVTGSKN